jgi:DNA-binding CsgD family transcriptional regulator
VVAVENVRVAPTPAVLSARERQVVAAAVTGRTNKLIAYELGLSDSTVRVLLGRAKRKLELRTRRELVALYAAHTNAITD